jgi:hypothetical protein
MSDCNVCAEPYNQTNRRSVTCSCEFKACMKCVERYLLDNAYKKTHCMACKEQWDSVFMKKHFSTTFLKVKYREKRENILFEEEKVFLPPLLEEAKYMMMIEKINKKIIRGRELLKENEQNEEQLVREQRERREFLKSKINDLCAEYHRLLALSRDSPKAEKKIFIMKCVVENCRGFLSTKYKCELCSVHVCKDCHVVIEDEEKKHECNPDDVATVIELQKTTRPCPKCQIRISKIDGCDQMFCIQCHTPFSWVTGMVETGPIHNPEYFRLLAKGDIIDVRHRQHQGGCGPMPDYYMFHQTLQYQYLSKDVSTKLTHYFQQMVHHRNATLPRFNARYDNKDRLKYLTGKYDEKTFKQKVYVNSESSLRKRDERQIIDSYVTIGEEMFRSIIRGESSEGILLQLEKLTEMTREAIDNLSNHYEFAGLVKTSDIRMASQV